MMVEESFITYLYLHRFAMKLCFCNCNHRPDFIKWCGCNSVEDACIFYSSISVRISQRGCCVCITCCTRKLNSILSSFLLAAFYILTTTIALLGILIVYWFFSLLVASLLSNHSANWIRKEKRRSTRLYIFIW